VDKILQNLVVGSEGYAMKVNEIINEAGIISGIKNALGRLTDRSAASQARIDQYVVNDAVSEWAKVSRQLTASGVNLKDPKQFQLAINRWLGTYIGGKGSPAVSGTITDFSSAGVKNYIAKTIADKPFANIGAVQPTGTAQVPEGYALKVVHPDTQGTYYKHANGQWKNEQGIVVQDANSIAYLERLADAGGRMVKTATFAQKVQQRKATRRP
jgi:hypothetical protein